tara:strand:+ start:21 stop:317 length:297 start_codon:yes stop_codon:yes gene_type:complete
MKKIKLSVAALLIAGSSYGQSELNRYNPKDSVKISKQDLEMIIVDLDDILSWQYEDMQEGHTNMGSYEEKWGSNYWLTLMRNKLACYYLGCENCDEID